MIHIFGLFAFIFGTIIGSFLNVVILRYKTGRTVGGRSFCFSCGNILHALELVPLFSFLALRGKCRTCKTPLSWQYPLVELITGGVFFLIFEKAAFEGLLYTVPFLWFAFSLLIVIAVYDAKHKIVPDLVAFIFGFSALAWLLATNEISYFASLPGLLDLLSGPIFFIPFFLLWFLSRGEWMGLGDGKLVVGLGWLLGIVEGASGIILGFWIAAGLSLLMLFAKRAFPKKLPFLSMRSEVPFAPFLVLGAFLAYYFSLDILSLNVLLFS
ncbi:MAG: prepilin peptidase [Candidatus Paceibacterota bacterium]|jgi:leader peptidase (prepilin peptidase)/N-methyltransferase